MKIHQNIEGNGMDQHKLKERLELYYIFILSVPGNKNLKRE
jgi:hypothetical protein